MRKSIASFLLSRSSSCVRGWVAEWLKAHAWKACGRATVSRVRISPHPLAPRRGSVSRGAFCRSRKAEREGASFTPNALDGEITVHRPRQLAADGEPQPGPRTARMREVHLDEWLEHRVEFPGRNA